MSVEEELSRFTPSGPVVLTIGVFDGVHLGHQHLLHRLQQEADQRGYQTAVVTFTNHPRTLLQEGFRVSYLTTVEERTRLLRLQGVDHVVPIPFTHELSLYTARQFVSLLCRVLHMRGMVVGPDFALGHDRQGTLPVLGQLGQQMGFFVQAVEPLSLEGSVVSSTAIRDALSRGELRMVNRCLGRPFRLAAKVERGAGRGRRIGFPTANLGVSPDQAVPVDGVYATWTRLGRKWYPSATNVGVRPTFGETTRTVEAFIMDFQGDLYGRQLVLDFVERLRDEVAYPSPEALVEQMRRDVEDARRVLASVGPGRD